MFIIVSDADVLGNFLDSVEVQQLYFEAPDILLPGENVGESRVVFEHPSCRVGYCTIVYTFGDVVCVDDLKEFVSKETKETA